MRGSRKGAIGERRGRYVKEHKNKFDLWSIHEYIKKHKL